MARKDVAGGLAAEVLDHFGEVVPGADAFVGKVVDAGIRILGLRIRSAMTGC